MLFKLLVDYRPKGVAVAWDTRPVHRKELHEDYKAERKEMPGLLREQFPYFRPIVEAFGYSNLEFEGWEADDVIATLATRADRAGVKTCVVSTDRDAFQLCSANVCLMMTPRGVSDVQVYTPERVEARYGIPPEQVPDFIGLKGDTSDNILGVPGIGDKTAAELIGKYGSVEGVLEHVDELTPARAKAIREHADQARDSKLLATMRRDLDIDCDPAALVLAPPDRSELKEMFRRFEFRNLLQARRRARGRAAFGGARALPRSWCRGSRARSAKLSGRVGVAVARRPRRGRAGRASPSSSGRSEVEDLRAAEILCHDFKALPHELARAGIEPAADTLLAAYLSSRAAPPTSSTTSPPSTGSSCAPEPPAEEETAALVRGAEAARRLAEPLLARVEELGMTSLYREIELPLTAVLAAMEDAGVRIDTYRMGEITARLADQVEELEARAQELAGEPFLLGSTQQVARDPLREARPRAGPQGEDRLLDRHARAARPPRRPPDRRR